MFEVRTIQGTPTASTFALGGGSPTSQPIVIDNTAGGERIFILNSAGEVVEMVSSAPYELRVAQGLVPGVSAFNKLGRNAAIGTSETYIASVGGSAPYMPTSAVGVEVLSSSTDDTSSGTGARTITIVGLDASFNQQQEVITMNGTSVVAAANTYRRVFTAMVSTVGTYGGSNLGNITIRQSSGGSSFCLIATGLGRSQSSHYCVPNGYTLYLDRLLIAQDTSKAMDVIGYYRNNADDTTVPVSPKQIFFQYDGLTVPIEFEFEPPTYFDGKTDIWMTGQVSAQTSKVSTQLYGYLIANA